MKEKATFIKLNRSILNWRWYKNANTMRVFVHLLLKANIKDHDFEDITVHRGQLVTSIRHLSTELQISERSIRTALNHLKTTQEVTIKTTAKYSIITIEKYDEYQNTTHKESINRHSNGTQSTSNRQQSKNDKKEKNEKNIYIVEKDSTVCNSLIIEIVEYLNSKLGTSYKPSTQAAKKHINARLEEGFSVDDFKKVIDQKAKEWRNTDMSKYLRPETLFGVKFESYLNSPVKDNNPFRGYEILN